MLYICNLKSPINYLPICFALAIACMAAGCGKSTDDPVYTSCNLVRFYAQGDTSQTSTKFQYDNSDRVVLVDQPGPNDMTINYSGNIITMGSSSDFVKYYLRPDSLAYASSRYLQGSLADTTLYTYDANGYLVKTVNYTTYFGKDSTLYTYDAQNLVSYKTYVPNGTVYFTNFEYNTTLSKSWYYRNFGPTESSGLTFPWLGKTNRNLIAKYSTNTDGYTENFHFTYVLNAGGYVTSVKYTREVLPSEFTQYFEYSCK